jgi:anaerobic ribonucleoside-triphosphate reductase activating protein
VNDTLRVAHIEPRTRVEGPGIRWALWVQGCTIGCAGCCNPHTWTPDGGFDVPVDALVENALAADVEGITLVGGEPFEQAAPLSRLARRVRDAGLGVVCFTGYTTERLRAAARPDWSALLTACDLVIDGPYVAHRPDTTRPWVGSTNQRFVHLTDRYAGVENGPKNATVEIRVRRDGVVTAVGWPNANLVEQLSAEPPGPR